MKPFSPNTNRTLVRAPKQDSAHRPKNWVSDWSRREGVNVPLGDREASASDPGLVAIGDCVRQWPHRSPGVASSTRDPVSTMCGNCSDSSAGIPDQRRSSGGDSRRAAAGTPVGCRLTAPAGTSRAGRPAHNSDTAVRSYRRCRTDGQAKNLETVVGLPRPRRRSFSNYKTDEMRSFYSGVNISRLRNRPARARVIKSRRVCISSSRFVRFASMNAAARGRHLEARLQSRCEPIACAATDRRPSTH
jgi:hypothetical protein